MAKKWYEVTDNAIYYKKFRKAKKAFFPLLIITIIILFSSFLCFLVWANNSGVLGEMSDPVDVSMIPFDVTKLPIVLLPLGIIFFIIMLVVAGRKKKFGRLYRPLVHSRATKREYLNQGKTLKVIYDKRWNNTYNDMLDGIIQDALNDGFTIFDDFKIKYNGKKAEVFELFFSTNLSEEELIEQCNRRNKYVRDNYIDMPEYFSETPIYKQTNLEFEYKELEGHGATRISKTDTYEGVDYQYGVLLGLSDPVVTEKINQLSEADFEYASSSDFSKLESLNNECTGIVFIVCELLK